MRRRGRALSLTLAALVLLNGCGAVEEAAVAPAPPEAAASEPMIARMQRGADTYSRAIELLSTNYAEGANSGRLLAASQRGAWSALAQVGALPLDVDNPSLLLSYGGSLEQMRQRYWGMAGVHADKVDPEWLAHEMVRGAANSLDDCHTGFLTQKQVQDQVARLSGTTKFGGVGVILRRASDNSGFSVVEVFEGGPAEKAGLRRGDLLVAVDGEPLKGLALEQVVTLVRGQEGTPVMLGISRVGSAAPLDVQVTRGQVAAPFIRAGVLPGNVGYIHLYSFPEPLVAQIDGVLQDFERRKVTGVVLDLRDNSGGQLDVVTKVTSRFVREGTLFQSVARGGDRTLYRADGSYWKAAKPLAVVVNNGTGSGGEILASAVKEHRAGTVVGVRSAGCVSTGQMFPLPDGSALEIATTRVVSGVKSSELNKVGVQPDTEVQLTPADLANDRDPQLDRAVEIVLGR